MAVGQSMHPAMTLLYREASSLLQWSGRDIQDNRYHPVGAGLPAMAVSQSMHPALTLLYREASSLLQGLVCRWRSYKASWSTSN